MRSFKILAGIATAIGLIGTSVASAQGYPTRPITIVVPAAPGGSTDALARLVARGMSEELGQNIVVENVGGAGGTVGMQRVARARPDGYTLGFGNMGQIAANVAVYPELNFDPRRDFQPIGVVANVPMVLAVSNETGITTLEGFLDYMRENPGYANFGSSGPGSTGHLAPTLLLSQTGLEAEILTYQGAGPALLDLISGLTQAQIDQTVMMAPVHRDRQATVLAVTGESRNPQFEGVPTFAEAGLPEFDLIVWNGLAAPAGIPAEVAERLESALLSAMETPAFNEQIATLGAEVPSPETRGTEPFREIISAEVDRWLETLGGGSR